MKVPVIPLKYRCRSSQEDRLACNSGLTLIEGLIAILVVSAVTTAITPMMFLSVATRVQNRRAEQAMQLAHGQIDEVRVLVERGISTQQDLEQLPSEAGDLDAQEVEAPTGASNQKFSTNSSCPGFSGVTLGQIGPDEAFPVDVNGNCEIDFFVQAFRTRQSIFRYNDIDIPIIFEMGVRVYYRNADFDQLETEAASLVMTTGEGQQTTRPLATLYTVMAQGDTPLSLNSYRCFINSNVVGCNDDEN